MSMTTTPRLDTLSRTRSIHSVKPCIIDGVLLVPITSTTLSAGDVQAPRLVTTDTTANKQREPRRHTMKNTYLSTGRSRLCRQRQKNYMQSLMGSVRVLRTELAGLQIMCDLRRDQVMFTRNSDSGSLVRMVRGYFHVFAHGLATEAPPVGIPATSRCNNNGDSANLPKKRSLARSLEVSPQVQREFMHTIMDPQVEVYDWIGHRVIGCQPLLNGWEMWSYLHSSFCIYAESVEMIDSTELLAVRANIKVCVTVSQRTLETFFPLATKDTRLREKLLNQEIVYAMREMFFFSPSGRVVRRTVDMDFIGALTVVLGNVGDVLALAAPFSTMAYRTSCAPPPSLSVSRHDMEYILS